MFVTQSVRSLFGISWIFAFWMMFQFFTKSTIILSNPSICVYLLQSLKKSKPHFVRLEFIILNWALKKKRNQFYNQACFFFLLFILLEIKKERRKLNKFKCKAFRMHTFLVKQLNTNCKTVEFKKLNTLTTLTNFQHFWPFLIFF